MNRLWLAVLLAAAPLAAQDGADALLARMTAAEDQVKTLRFAFTQTTEIKLTGEKTALSGKAAFRRPDRFRLEHQTPRALTAISDGKTLWVHIPERNQVLQDTWDGWSRSAGFPQGLAPFQQKASDLRAKYNVALEGADTLKLTPKKKDSWEHTLWVTVDGAGMPSKTVLESQGVRSVTQISAVELNPALPDDLFVFTSPKGTEVIRMPSRQGPEK